MDRRRRDQYGYAAMGGGLTEEDVRRIARAEARALLTSVDARNVYPPRSIPRRTIDSVTVAGALPATGVDGDEAMVETSNGQLVPFLWRGGGWKPTGSFLKASFAVRSFGPLPVSGSFTKEFDDTVVAMWFSGSAFAGVVGTMQVNVEIDGTAYGSMFLFANETASHKALVASPIVFPDTTIPVPSLAAGDHAIEFVSASNASTDANDAFYCLVIESFGESI
jgi:hypothetical protein